MPEPTDELISRVGLLHARVCESQLPLLLELVNLDRAGDWEVYGARDCAHFLAMQLDISEWKARRWLHAAHALQSLPRLREALAQGELGIDKVVKLARFATATDEARLIRWAHGVSGARIRERGDELARRSLQEDKEAHEIRSVSWSFSEEGRRFSMHTELPGAEGVRIARTLEAEAAKVPVMPGEEDDYFIAARRADALVALVCSDGSSEEVDRTTVVVHAPAEALILGRGGCHVERGPIVHSETVRRWLCSGRMQAVVEDEAGDVVAVGRLGADPPRWMRRQLRYRDRECRFPKCGARRFLQAHHIVWLTRGGRTELANLVLICFFHHRLVHELGWSLMRRADGAVAWFSPDGERYSAGPAPPVRITA